MSDVNRVIVIGRLTRDAELKYTQAGFAISNFSVAVNRRRKNGEQWVDEANYFDVSLFGKQAETLKPYLVKGKQIAVEGELKQDRWEQDGQPRSKVVISASNVQLLGGGQGAPGGQTGGSFGQYGGGYASQGGPQGGNYQQTANKAFAGYASQVGASHPPQPKYEGCENEGFEDDIPF
ncbi:MAG: single-stranded DNA-binding protein [Treponemataceae bacterium]|nr:MAG: single-stranded DNA-binding protein [Treponemataceae bacterium]